MRNELAVPPALHSNDLRYYFPRSGGPPNYNNEQFRKAMVHFIIAFALEGDPNLTMEDTITPNWSPFEYGSKTGRVEMLFNRTEGGRPAIEPVLADEHLIERCEFWASVNDETGQ
ncbi:hypothetical protein CYLTODRAFT_489730 [Cylindrobasidium torrendii FP15055 ss-10]|uniref:Uncharacterized protein n=1 Tax=Cylindrobasidium torrendii FP15055 ss-10 TaxID=1314674 RepID=A0A0D7BDC3_9AGAR|nr:hypothetical protein CYLTODRAFT_489730 [Cylindrobasidium torrendii FP15055 ss-10]